MMFAGFYILAFGFLTPWLMGVGAAATSIPIVIHLLNKRKFRMVMWAAMDFLLAAQRRNARRLKFQRWLLLALRCLALLVLAAAIAQFYLDGSAIGSMLGGGQRAVVVIWDDSYSMAYRSPGKPSHFDASKKLLTDWVTALPANDKVAVVRASAGAPPFIEKPTLDHRAAEQAIAALTVSDAGTDLPTALDRATQALDDVQRTAGSRTVLLITDLSRSSLGQGANESQVREALKKKMAEIAKTAEVKVVDVGESDQSNHAVVEMKTRRPMVVAGMPAELQIQVTNGSDAPLLEQPLTLSVDGTIQTTEKLGRIGPGETRTTTVAVTIATPGRHILEAAMPGDLLPVDDVRRLALQVTRELPILLVDGNPGDNRTLGSTTFVQLAYAPQMEGKTTGVFEAKVITELELPRTPLGALGGGGEKAAYAAVILSDTGKLDSQSVANLQRYVQDGGLVMVFPGGRTNANDMNQTLGEGGAKLLAAPYGQMTRMEISADAPATEGLHLDPMNYAHPVLEPFAAAARSGTNAGLTSAQVSRYLRLAVPTDGSVETILMFSDGNAAVITKRVGKGRVVQFATSADTSWNSFPARPSFVPFMWELMFYGIANQAGALTLELGQPIRLPVDAAPAGTWNAPHGAKIQTVTTVDAEKRAWLTSAPLTMAGLYGPSSAGAQPVIAVNADGREADIRHVKAAEMAGALGIAAGDIVEQPRTLEVQRVSAAGKTNPNNSLGLNLILAALVLFAMETVMARMFSVYR